MAERGSPFNLTLVPFSPHYGNLTDTSVPTFPAAYRDRPKSKANENGDYANGDCGLKSDGTRRDCHTIMIESLPGNETMNCTADTSERPKAKPDSNDGPCELQQYLRDRIRMVQSLDELIRAVREELTEAGLWESTYLIFTSDNGYHLGQGIALGLIEDGSAGFRIGKGSPFETDLRVPLVVAGADAAVGVVRHEPAQGVDFLPTFTDMQPSLNGDTTTFENHDGMSLLPLIRGESVTGWRNWVYSVHTEVPDASSAGPDSEPGTLVQKGFFSLRAGGELYVQHVDGADRGIISRYTIEETPNGRYNNPLDWAALPIGTQDLIRSQFDMFAKCIGGETAGATSCQAAARAAAP